MSDWTNATDKTPSQPGWYEIHCFTGVIRDAYWTGNEWRDMKSEPRLPSLERNIERAKRSDRHLAKLIRFWRTK